MSASKLASLFVNFASIDTSNPADNLKILIFLTLYITISRTKDSRETCYLFKIMSITRSIFKNLVTGVDVQNLIITIILST